MFTPPVYPCSSASGEPGARPAPARRWPPGWRREAPGPRRPLRASIHRRRPATAGQKAACKDASARRGLPARSPA